MENIRVQGVGGCRNKQEHSDNNLSYRQTILYKTHLDPKISLRGENLAFACRPNELAALTHSCSSNSYLSNVSTSRSLLHKSDAFRFSGCVR